MNCDSVRSLYYDMAPIVVSIISCETLWYIFIRLILTGIDSTENMHTYEDMIYEPSCAVIWISSTRHIKYLSVDKLTFWLNLLCEQLQNRKWDRFITLPWHDDGQQERFNICSVVFELLAFCSYTSKGNWQFSREHAYYEVPCYLWQQRFTGSYLLITTTQPCTDTFQYFISKSRGVSLLLTECMTSTSIG